MEHYLEKLLSEKDPRGADMEFFWNNYLHKCEDMTNIRVSYTLNDSGDILIRIKPSAEYAVSRKKQLEDLQAFEDNTNPSHEKINQCSFFYYIPSSKSSLNLQEFMYFDSEVDELYDIQGTSMNERFIFFWNLGIVWSLNLQSREMK